MVSRRRRTPADRDGLAPHPRAGRGRRGARRLHRRVHRVVEPRGAAQIRRARAGHQRACVHAAAHHGQRIDVATGRRPRSRRRSTRSASAPRCSSTPTTSPQGWPTRSRWPAPGSGPCASTPAIWACWPARSATSSTASAPRRPASWSPVTSTSSRSPRCAPSPSTSTASAHRWSPARGRRPPSMVYKLVEVDGIPVEKRSSHKESHGGRKQAPAAGQAVGHHRRGGRPSGRQAAAGIAGAVAAH